MGESLDRPIRLDREWVRLLMARQALGPASLAVAQAVDAVLPDSGRVRVGVSGGADSMALAAGLVWALGRRRRAGEPSPEVIAMVVDHGLQEGSEQVAQTVRGRLEQLGLAAEVARAEGIAPHSNVEAVARERRLGLLCEGVEAVMLGHTLDDQAETVLLGLARGSGVRSLSGMGPAQPMGDVVLLRPLLGLRRETTREACREQGLPVWEDPHNASAAFARVRVRTRLLPALEQELGPGIAEALARTAVMAREDAEALDQWADRALQEAREGQQLAVAALQDLPAAVASRALRAWLVEQGAVQPTRTQVAQTLELVTRWHGQGPLHLEGVQIGRLAGMLRAQAR